MYIRYMKDTIKWSHSKLAMILNCPMTYYLSYIQGISVKKKKPALEIGSAVHWGIENNTYDLRQYYLDNNDLGEEFTQEQLLAQAMDYFYLTFKDRVYDRILLNKETGEVYNLVQEKHEGFTIAKLPSNIPDLEPHNFLGIIDLLLRTDQGFIIIDFKTSTYEPKWDEYLDQLYRYIYLVKMNYPDVPILKIGIVNIRKAQMYKRKDVSAQDYFTQLCKEYIEHKEQYIDYHEYPAESIDPQLMDNYIKNLSKMVDTAYIIDREKSWYINYAQAVGQYGKSDYYDMFYKTKNAYKKYKIKDKVWSEEKQDFVKERDCIPLDMEVIDNTNVLNHYSDYCKAVADLAASGCTDIQAALKEQYKVDDNLLELYSLTQRKSEEIKNNNKESSNEELQSSDNSSAS